MKIRVIDYLANPGGGVRFAVELVKGLRAPHPAVEIELVSHGHALRTYTGILRRGGDHIRCTDLAPSRYWKTQPAGRIAGVPGTGRVKRWLGFDSQWHFDVPAAAVARCDVAWFPWMHRHRLPEGESRHLVGSFHDAIVFLWPGLVSDRQLADERETVARWLASPAWIAVSSQTTLRAVAAQFGTRSDRLSVIPLAGTHVLDAPRTAVPGGWMWQANRYLFYPANTSAHKNHEVLMEGFARWGAKVPLLLTGYGADLSPDDLRGRALRELANVLGLHLGASVIAAGYVDDGVYYTLLSSAWALVMPSLLEGGGSFPVMEAMLLGVPVVCSDTPVMREQLERTGGEVLWFDPRDPDDLARALDELFRHYGTWRAKAGAQVQMLRRRTWQDVADAYWALFEAAAGGRR